MENWKDVSKFEGIYKVSDKGNIVRLAHDRHLGRGVYKRIEDKIRKITNRNISLNDGDYGKGFVVARLVYLVFNDVKLQRNHIILHKDGNDLNNSLSNLKLITKRNYVASYMNNKSGYTGVTEKNKEGFHVAKIDFEGVPINLHTSKDINECNKLYQAAKRCFEEYDRIKTQILSSTSKNRLINKSVKM